MEAVLANLFFGICLVAVGLIAFVFGGNVVYFRRTWTGRLERIDPDERQLWRTAIM